MEEKFPVLSGKDIFSRIKQSLKPKSIADMAKELNFQKGTVYRWKTSNIIPKTQDILKIAIHLNVSLTWLLTGKDEKSSKSQIKDYSKITFDIIIATEKLNDEGKKVALNVIEGLEQKYPLKNTDQPTIPKTLKEDSLQTIKENKATNQ